jgi:hypothetical protein
MMKLKKKFPKQKTNRGKKKRNKRMSINDEKRKNEGVKLKRKVY